MEHLQRVWHASTARLPFRTPGSVSLVLQLLRPDSWNLPCLYPIFTLNTPWYFLDFASYLIILYNHNSMRYDIISCVVSILYEKAFDASAAEPEYAIR